MLPLIYKSNWIIIPTWHVFFFVAVMTSYFYLHFLRHKFYTNICSNNVIKFFFVSYLSSYIGARFLSILVEEKTNSITDFFLKLISLGPLTFYGGFISALLFNFIFLTRKKESFFSYLDLGIPSCLLGLSIGRIGCFFNGDDYGLPASKITQEYNPWWAVSFPNHSNPIPRLPIQLIESLGVSIIVIILYKQQKKNLKHPYHSGQIGLLGVISYASFRFILEWFRDDFRGVLYPTIFSTSQTISFILIIISSIFLIKVRNQQS